MKMDAEEAAAWNAWRKRLDEINVHMPPRAVAVHWFCASDEIKQMGPYATQAEAVKHLRKPDGCLISGAIVWCEEIE